jgi:hypothetical protein
VSDGGLPTRRRSIGAMVMMVVGGLLLLPVLCTIVFTAMLISDKPTALSDPYVQVFVPFMAVCVLVSAGGILLIRAGRRRRSGNRPADR